MPVEVCIVKWRQEPSAKIFGVAHFPDFPILAVMPREYLKELFQHPLKLLPLHTGISGQLSAIPAHSSPQIVFSAHEICCLSLGGPLPTLIQYKTFMSPHTMQEWIFNPEKAPIWRI
jgi:hypothetical protein